MKRLLTFPLAFISLILQSFHLALSQIWANKVRSMLTTIGIIIGVASVTAVIASLTGLKAKVLADFESFGTKKIYVMHKRPSKGRLSHASWWSLRLLPEQFDGLLEHCPSVEQFTRICSVRQSTIRYGENSVEAVRISAVEPAWSEIENRSVLLGRPFSMIDETQGRQVCLIDPDLRDKLRLDKDCIGQLILMGGKAFRVVGVIEPSPEMAVFGGGGGEDVYEMFIPFKTNLKLSRHHWIYVIAASKSTEFSDDAKAELTFFLRRTRHIRPGEQDNFRVQSVESQLKTFNQIAIMITAVAGGIVGISLLVGGVGIMNIMLVSVSERTREIGLRKAVGARKSAILTQFLIEAVVLCIIGGLVGVGIGELLTIAISALHPMMDKTQIPLWAIALSFGFATSVGVFFGMFPAIKAARLDPIEALRHE